MADKQTTMTGLSEVALGILFLIIIYGVVPMIGDGMDNAVVIPRDAYASGTLTFTGNVSNGDLVNITSGTNVYRFEFNATSNGSVIICKTANCIPVNLTGTYAGGVQLTPVYNTSVLASGYLTTAMNANVSVAALITAVDTTNRTTITSDVVGSAYNGIATSENGALMSWGSTTLAGGDDASPWGASGIPTGAGTWATLAPFLTLSAIILIVAGFLTTLKGLKNKD